MQAACQAGCVASMAVVRLVQGQLARRLHTRHLPRHRSVWPLHALRPAPDRLMGRSRVRVVG